MSQQINLEIIDDQVKVTSPYHAQFVFKARRLRGKWKEGAWWFDDSVLDYVRDLMEECFGTTGEVPYKSVNLLVKDFSETELQGPVELFGRTIARAMGRDSGARLGDEIVLISGDIGSSGSVKNWRTYVSDATFEIHNFPLPATEKEDIQQAIKEGWVEIKHPKKKRSRKDIEAEIAQLQQRILELTNELENDA